MTLENYLRVKIFGCTNIFYIMYTISELSNKKWFIKHSKNSIRIAVWKKGKAYLIFNLPLFLQSK